jgi:lipocalin
MIQKPAPEFKGTLVKEGEFQEVSLSDYKGKWVVLASYPLDFSELRALYRRRTLSRLQTAPRGSEMGSEVSEVVSRTKGMACGGNGT